MVKAKDRGCLGRANPGREESIMNAMATTVSRRGVLARLLLAAAVAPVLGVTRADNVAADKKKKKKPKITSVADRTDSQRFLCEEGGGKLAVQDGPEGSGGNTTECKGGTDNGRTCINTKKSTKCSQALTSSPTKPGGGGAVPPSGGVENPSGGANPGGGGAVPPSGGNEDPTGGANPGGGAHVPPGGGVDPDGGGSGPVLE
jgi:hypothetical protein